MTDQLSQIHTEASAIAKSIQLLGSISWPAHLEKEFFEHSSPDKRPNLDFTYKKRKFPEEKAALKRMQKGLSNDLSTHVFTRKTLDSYIQSMTLLETVGTKEFTELSIEIYGRPNHLLFESSHSHLESAKTILKIYSAFDHPYLSEPTEQFDAESLRDFLQRNSHEILGEDTPDFVLSDDLTAKAAAGKTRVRLRSGAVYSEYDFNQLLIHEVMTHTLTSVNGSAQPNLPLLGLEAPRTTKTQEGLATFAEIISGNMDLRRLKRLALRVLAIDLALNGADFYDLYDFFVGHGQTSKESYLSASRILRGGYSGGGIVFTKDGVYLEGMIRVHSFFRWALKTSNLDLIHLLFAGRLDINDTFLLRPAFNVGAIDQPKYLPKWYQQISLLAGKLAFSVVLNNINLGDVDAHFSSKL